MATCRIYTRVYLARQYHPGNNFPSLTPIFAHWASAGRSLIGRRPDTGTARKNLCRGKRPMLTVHHLNNSRSQRVLWLLEELGVPYEIVRYQRQPDMRAPKELRAIHPLGKSPVITDNGNTIAESGAIAEYLINTYGKGRLIPPENTPERLRYTYWLHYAEGSAMSPLLLKLLFTLMPRRTPALLRPLVRKVCNQALTTLVNPQLKQHMDYWESELGKSEWFAGNEFSAADIQMSFPLEAAAARAGLEQGHPKAMAFVERIHARPAYKRALEKGGPYEIGR